MSAPRTWGSIYNAALRRGLDHGYAAYLADQWEKRRTRKMTNEAPEHIMQFFAWQHLPAHLQAVSRPFGEMAETMVNTLPRNPERTVALRKLLEAKDAAVRAMVAK